MYVDDEGSIRGLPRNLRASEIAHCCGKPLEVCLTPPGLPRPTAGCAKPGTGAQQAHTSLPTP